MKRLLIAILASSFLLPMCGSVLALSSMETEHSIPNHHTSAGTPQDMTMSHPESMDQNDSSINCCTSSHVQCKNEVLERGAFKKSLENVAVGFSPVFSNPTPGIFSSTQNHRPATAPPPESLTYSSLIGIIKRLD